MKQVVKRSRKNQNSRESVKKKKTNSHHNHPKFGTSKLEQDFAKNFLDKEGIKYIWQYEAKDIKRSYDFYLPDSNILIEVDGDYW